MSISLKAVSPEELGAAATTCGTLGPYGVTRQSARIPSGDGDPLDADVFHPADDRQGPVLLMRTAYGRGGFSHQGIYFASHGYHCVLQDTRGPSSYFHEESDGGAAAAWIAQQPWYDGNLGLFGTSYMGFTAYATAATRPAGLRALAVSAYSADRTSAWYPGGSFGLDLALPWAAAQATPEADPPGEGPGVDDSAFLALPLPAADQLYCAQELPFYQERLRFGGASPHWAPLDFSHLLSEDGLPPTLLIDGWNDYHRPYLWADFLRLHARRRCDRIVAGPWSHHIDPVRSNLETLSWFERHLRHTTDHVGTATAPVSVHINPDVGWRELPTWPAPGSKTQRWYLGPGGTLERPRPTDSPERRTDRYTYDPADPTPAVALSSFAPVDTLTQTDNRELEARADVLTYTSDEFERPVTLIGPVTADLWVTSSTPHTDFYARITDVHPDGRSLAIAQTLRRLSTHKLTDPSTPLHITLDLGPVAHRLAPAHRLRLQLASGAHPFYARNLGTGEDLPHAIAMTAADQAVHYGNVTHPSGITVRIDDGPDSQSPG
ncbi:CocE/NonD family hydrolase [Streptomyces sp. NPDC056716]|uniref:CocE/NonD family hydrolase n=1 Tax=unclassified Streptomyces TaxID=2593676 RepID=UPI0036C51ABC